jgi:hypothetical protein
MKTYAGKVRVNPYGDWSDVSKGIQIGVSDWIENIFTDLEGKNVKVTIEILPDDVEEDDSPVIEFRLKDIIKNDDAIKFFRLDPWCVNEGADGNVKYSLTVNKAKELGLL